MTYLSKFLFLSTKILTPEQETFNINFIIASLTLIDDFINGLFKFKRQGLEFNRSV